MRQRARDLSPSLDMLGFLAMREAVRTKAYKDSAGVWTIGIGHTCAAGYPCPRRGMRITTIEAFRLLLRDIEAYAEPIRRAVTVPISQHEFDALVSLSYNIGARRAAHSGVVKHLNEGDRRRASKAFMSWVKAGGHVSRGLINRRKAERRLFDNGDYGYIKPGIKATLSKLQSGGYSNSTSSVRRIQRRLKALGYHEVGTIDGIKGGRTDAAILAFRNDNGLPLTTDIDDDFLSSLSVADVRDVAGPRRRATASTLRDLGSTDIRASDHGLTGGAAVGGLAAVAGAGEVLKTVQEPVKVGTGIMQQVMSVSGPVIGFIRDNAVILLAISAAFIIWQAVRLRRNRVRRHRSGEYLSR